MKPRAIVITAAVLAAPSVLMFGPAAGAGAVPPNEEIDAARAGLAWYIGTNLPEAVSTSTDVPGCPVIELDNLQNILVEQGFTGSLEDWGTKIEWDEYEQFGPEVVGLVCGGDTDGDAHDSTAGLSVGVFAVDLPDEADVADLYEMAGVDTLVAEDEPLLGGAVSSGCSGDDGEQMCIAAWNLDSFVVGVHLWSSEQQLDNGSASAVLHAMLPDGISNLADLEVPNA